MNPEYWSHKTGELPMSFHGFEVWHQDFYNPLIQKSYSMLIEEFPKLQNL